MNSTISGRHNPRHIRQAMNLWLSLHRLGNVLDTLSAQAPPATIHAPPDSPPAIPPWPSYPSPSNQAVFHVWVSKTYRKIFNSEAMPESPIIPIDAPKVRGLTVYAAKCDRTRYFGAWTKRSGVFIGWMRIQPQIAGIESDYAVGEVLGRPVFMGIMLDLSGHDAIDKFTQALKEAAWDLGVASG